MSGVEMIKEPPEFRPDVDPMLLAKFGEKYPEVAHVLARVSTESAARRWLTDRVIDLNNSHVESMSIQEETNQLLRDLTKSIEDMSKQLALVQQQSEANAQTILDWTIRFKSPLSILGAFIGVIITALIGAWISQVIDQK